MAGKARQIKELSAQVSQPDFWRQPQQAAEVSKQLEDLKEEAAEWQELTNELKTLAELAALTDETADQALAAELNERFESANSKFRQLEFAVLFNGPYDEHNAIVAIHAGTGGVDAQDWAAMLERLYLRFAEDRGWQVEILDRNTGNEAGIKNNLLRLVGRWAYGYLRSEAGVHRLVRISPFDAEALRQTSFALVEVIPELPEAETLAIKDEDLEFNFFRSSGPGGQNVNKTSSAVRLTHKPTGLTVTCQTERSQHQNRERALAILKSKLYQLAAEKQLSDLQNLKGEIVKAEWGRQIRSYVLDPYQLVKDHRTNWQTSDVKAVLDGEILPFIEAYLQHARGGGRLSGHAK